MKRVVIFLLIATMVWCLFASCAQAISEEKIEVDAVISNVRKRIKMVGKTFVTDRDIYFEYDDIAGSWDVGYKTYNAYKDKEGETIKCYLITYTYEDGSTKMELVAVEDYNE